MVNDQSLVPLSVEAEMAAIEHDMMDSHGEYYTGIRIPDGNKTVMEARYLELIESKLQDRQAPLGLSGLLSEKHAIEYQMKRDREAYFKNEALQRRYREILEELGDFSVPPSKMVPVAGWDYELDETSQGDPDLDDFEERVAFFESPGGREIIAQWERQGGAEKNAATVDALVAELKSQIPEVHNFEQAVLGLSVATQMHMSVDLSRPYVNPDITATDQQIDYFLSIPFGADLADEWGNMAERNIGMIFERLLRISHSLTYDEQVQFKTFIETLPPEQFKTIARFLVG